MARQQLQETSPARAPSRDTEPREYPVREYIAEMTFELAQMARWDGDEVLAELLEAAALRAEKGAS